jgi:D-threo-aldose 1-dehydrogenase
VTTDELPIITIPGTGVRICRLGFGCSRLFGEREFKASARLVEAALEAGIRHFDTAPLYGGGDSERVVGSVTTGIPGVTITTKVGIPRPGAKGRGHDMRSLYRRFARPILSRFPALKAGLVTLASARRAPAAPAYTTRVPLAPADVLRQLEDSLRCLGRDHVDIYLIHEPDQFELTDELENCFRDLQSKGVIGAFGLGYDRVAQRTDPRFGSVLQGRYAGVPEEDVPARMRIFHGVLRQSSPDQSPRARIGEALRAWPQSAVLFSASAPFQIREVAQGAGYKSS